MNNGKLYNASYYPDQLLHTPAQANSFFYNQHASFQDSTYVFSDSVSINPYSDSAPLIVPLPITENCVQTKEQILEEIVCECNEIERLSTTSASPSSNWSSDEQEFINSPKQNKAKTPEKKERKKAQNRLAATRYREKKRREKEAALNSIEKLNDTNNKLKKEIGELEQEIRYFKKFMREMGMQERKK